MPKIKKYISTNKVFAFEDFLYNHHYERTTTIVTKGVIYKPETLRVNLSKTLPIPVFFLNFQ